MKRARLAMSGAKVNCYHVSEIFCLLENDQRCELVVTSHQSIRYAVFLVNFI